MSKCDQSSVAYIVMGICGCGKSTVAKNLADSFGIDMLDADDFHPKENVAKMAAGIPLDDTDRAGWLKTLNSELSSRLCKGESIVLACSALKQRYRDVISDQLPACRWIYLRGSRALIVERMLKRENHYMPATLIDSQLQALEEPVDAIVVDISNTPEEIQERISDILNK